MNRIFQHIAVIVFVGSFLSSVGQNGGSPDLGFEDIIESLVDDLEDEADYLSALEYLEIYYENPLNINEATETELKKLSLLNEIQVSNLLLYRRQTGEIYSVFELNSIEGFNREIIEKIMPFVRFDPSGDETSKVRRKQYSNHQLMVRSTSVLQEARGYKSEDGDPPKYEGSRAKLYARYRYQLGETISAGFTAEKDPGEALFSGSNKNGFDYYSAHISMNFNSVVQNVTVGDFLVRSGQGLVLFQGFSPGKSSAVLTTSKNAQGVHPYGSTDENRFFRGASVSLDYKNYGLNLFFSHKKRDANLAFADSLMEATHFTSLQSSGFHRTTSEIDDEKSVKETSAGAVLSYQKNRLKVGATVLLQKFHLPLILSGKPYNLFKFSGESNTNIGVDYRYLAGKYQLFGEAAVSQSNGLAFLQGVTAHLNDRYNFSSVFRHFDKNYQALYGNAFSESTNVINETGLYLGVKLLPVKNIRISGYTDFYKSPWLSYTTFAPSKGNDVFMQIDYTPSQKVQMYVRFKTEEKDIKIHVDEKYINTPYLTKRLRFHTQYYLSEQFTLKSRFEYSYYKKYESEHGFMFYQDVVFTPTKIPWLKSQLRLAIINTDSYNSRIYAYENDLLYNYSIPAYYGKAMRAYLNISYKFSTFFDVWLKLVNTTYSDRVSIGSGYNEVQGKSLTEVKIQARFKF